MTLSRRMRRWRGASSGERGATAVFVAGLSTVLLGSAALAVDVGGFYDRAHKIQNAADAASLAAVETLVATNDLAAARVEANKLLKANGIDPADARYTIDVNKVGTDKVTVSVRDADLGLFFSKLFSDEVSATRDAAAKIDTCRSDCHQEVAIPRPNLALQALGSGDGFVPILANGAKLFAINHKIGDPAAQVLVCIDRATNAQCAGYPKSLGTYTNFTPRAVVVNEKFYFTAQKSGEAGIGCWDSNTDASCGYLKFDSLAVGAGDTRVRLSSPALVGGKIWFFSDQNKVYCVNPGASMSQCAGYPKNNGLQSRGLPALNWSSNGKITVPMEIITGGSKIYSAVHYMGQTYNGNPLGSQLHCWDTATGAKCAGFGPVADPDHVKLLSADNGDNGGNGALFAHYSTSKAVNGVCLVDQNGANDHLCSTLDGTSTFRNVPLRDLMKDGANGNGNVYDMYDELYLDGRTYFAEGWVRHGTLCWDWVTNATCGRKQWNTGTNPVGNTSDYGYATNGKCIIGLGHENRWWTFDKNMAPCKDTSVELTIARCTCIDGRLKWGNLKLQSVNLTPGVQFTEFTVTIRSPSGDILKQQSMLGTDGTLSLQDIPVTVATNLIMEIQATSVDGWPAWSGGNVPKVSVEYREVPSLVD